LVLLNKVK